MPLRKIAPEMMKMLRNGTWAKYIHDMQKQRQQVLRTDGGDDYEHDIISYSDIEYLAEITIGTPEQTFLVLLDTSTWDPWVPEKSCYKQPDKPSDCQSSHCDIGLICDVFCAEQSCCTLISNDTTQNPCRRKRRFDMRKSSTYAEMRSNFTTRRKRYVEGFYGRGFLRFVNSFQAHFDGVIGLGFVFASPLLRAIMMGLLDQPIFTVFLKRTRRGLQCSTM
ncbi:hypothetical protein Y032_0260g518 [Ancylostoma ceylanicum]|nr:hypothetical protein Y032_0260g518 [Ancylostoma ceylanicum]